MALADILRKEYNLSESQIAQIIDFAQFLQEKNKPKPIGYREDGTPFYRKAGALKGKIQVSDDFDDPLEDFEEYM